MFSLIVEDKTGKVTDEFQFDSTPQPLTIGRSRECHILLPSDNVSRKHAEIFVRANQIVIRDLGSSNGVVFQGQRIQNEVTLPNPAQVGVGDFKLIFEKLPTADTRRTESTPEEYVHLVGMNLGVAGRHYSVTQQVNLVGRGRDCSTTVIDPSVSRVHAKLSWTEGQVLWVEDLKSANGTFINGIRIEKSALTDGDILRFGNVEFRVAWEDAGAAGHPRPEQTASGIRAASGRDSKRLLQLTIGGIVAAILLSALVLLEPFGGDVPVLTESAPSQEEPSMESPPSSPEEDSAEEIATEAAEALASRKWEKAEVLYRRALQKDPLSESFKKGQQQALLELKNAQFLSDGLRFLEGSLYGDAMKALRQVTKGSVYRQEANLQIEDLYLKKEDWITRGKKAYKKRRYKEAERLYSYAVSIDPTDEAVVTLQKKAARKAKRSRR